MNEHEYLEWVRDRWERDEAASPTVRRLHQDPVYLSACLMGESAEAWDVIKKPFRAGRDMTPAEDRNLLLELGDAYHYLTRLADLRGYTMDEIRVGNVIKLIERDEVATRAHHDHNAGCGCGLVID